ncbi:MAG TPA: hypothetical protein VFI06_16900, partial [Chitinophagaceae bacterium]|nr:hypothetical protein [Chitinophagaceae bacterium]
ASLAEVDIDSMELDEFFSDLDLFLDSILSPRSYALLSLSATQGYFTFTNKNNSRSKELKKTIWSPTFGYYDKNGLGITLSSFMIRDSARRYFYQMSATPSYDYIKNRKFATGVSFTRYFTRNRLPFYTSPLQNELTGYFLWRKAWLQPGIAANYGWGSKTEFKRIEVQYIKIVEDAATDGLIRQVETATIISKNRESIVDFSLNFSLRHDFYWLDIFSKKDHIRFSPLLSATGGTQKFGFNQSNTPLGNVRAAAFNNFNNTGEVSLLQKFQLLYATLYLRGEYSFGKFFVQPQVLFDCYLPGKNNQLTTLFSVNTGFIF